MDSGDRWYDPVMAVWAARLARHRVPERYRDSYARLLCRLSGYPQRAGEYSSHEEFAADLERVSGIADDLAVSWRAVAVVEHPHNPQLTGSDNGVGTAMVMFPQMVSHFSLHTNRERCVTLVAAPPALLTLWPGRGGWEHENMWCRLTVLGQDGASLPAGAAEEFCRVWDRDPDSADRVLDRVCDPGYDGLLPVLHDPDPAWRTARQLRFQSELETAVARISQGGPRPTGEPGSHMARREGQVDRLAGGALEPGWEYPWPAGVQRCVDAANVVCGIAVPAAVLATGQVVVDESLAEALDGLAPAVDMSSCQLLHERFAALGASNGAAPGGSLVGRLVLAGRWLAEQAVLVVHGAKDHTRMQQVEARLRDVLDAAAGPLGMIDRPVAEAVHAVARGSSWADAAWVNETVFPVFLAAQAAAQLWPAGAPPARRWPVAPAEASTATDLADRDQRWETALSALGGNAQSVPEVLRGQPGEVERFLAAGVVDAAFMAGYLDVRDRPDRMVGLRLDYSWDWSTEGFEADNLDRLARFHAAWSHFAAYQRGGAFTFSAAAGLHTGGSESTYVAAGVVDPADMDRLRDSGADDQDIAAYSARGATSADEMLRLRAEDEAAGRAAALYEPDGGPIPASSGPTGAAGDTCAWWPDLRAGLERRLAGHCYLWFRDVEAGRLVFELICWPASDDATRISAAEVRTLLTRAHRRWVASRHEEGRPADSFHHLPVSVALRVETRGLQARYIGHGAGMAYLTTAFPGVSFALSDEGTLNGRQCVGLRWAGGPSAEQVTDVIAAKGHLESVDASGAGVWLSLWKGYLLLVRSPSPPTDRRGLGI